MFENLYLAYIDPVSGTLIVQLLIAGFVGVVGFFRRSIWAMGSRIFRKKSAGTGQ